MNDRSEQLLLTSRQPYPVNTGHIHAGLALENSEIIEQYNKVIAFYNT